MKAIVLQGEPGKVELSVSRPLPKIRPTYILVDVKAIAANPADWKHIDFMNSKDCLSGCDFAGVVAETGEGYSKDWKVGDRICGFAHGDAATLGVGIVTCGQGLFQEMSLARPSQPITAGPAVLVYGGSSATGTLGIQLLKLSGYTVITTCSPKSFDLVKSRGADAAFDYKDSDCVARINDFTGGKLNYAWDTICTSGSAKICAGVVSAGGIYGTLVAVDWPRSDVRKTFTLGYTAMGEPIQKRGNHFDKPEDLVFTKEWIAEVEPLLDSGKLQVHPKQVHHGFEAVISGLDLVRKSQVHGQKLVFAV